MARAAARKERAVNQIASDNQTDRPSTNSDAVEVLFTQHTDLSIGEIMALTGQSRTTVHRRLKQLVETRALERRGEGRASRYHRIANSKTK
jgi:Fic family protein